MAQSAIASLATNSSTMNPTERKELREYEKIIHFRDVVYSGTHPRIKLPSHMAVKPLRTTSIPTAPQPSSTATAAATSNTAEKRNQRQEKTQGAGPSPGTVKADTTGERRPLLGKANNTGIDPIFLEKSDTLRKAEIQIRRKDIERILREQIAKQQTAAKVAQVTGVVEQLPDFDVHEVLSKALVIARAQPVDVRHAFGRGEPSPAASDSFDDNTFYSSVVESPELSTSSRERLETGEVTSRPLVPLSSAFDGKPASESANDLQNRGQDDLSSSRTAIPVLQAARRKQTPPSQHGLQGREQALPFRPSPPNRSQQSQQGYHSQESTSANSQSTGSRGLAVNGRQGADRFNATSSTGSVITRPEGTNPSRMDVDSAITSKETAAQVNRQVSDVIPQQRRPMSTDEPGDVRNFNLSPVAPQPVRVSPLATAKGPPFAQRTLAMDNTGGNDGAATGRSTAAFTQDGKQKGKRKHSNGRPGTPTSPASPYIKTEPRSPSPFMPAPLPRPNKRRRPTAQQSGGLDYDEQSYEEPKPQPKQPQQQPSQRNARNARPQPPPQQQDDAQNLMEIDEPRYRRALQDESQQRRITSHEVSRIPPSPRNQAVPYSPYEQRVARPSTQLIIDPYEQSPRYIQTPVSASVRPEIGRDGSADLEGRPRRSPVMMAPPPRMSSRLVVDEYGNQYYASLPVVPRQSMLPQSRVVEQEYIFDRPAPRRVARPVHHVYGEDGVLYQREPTYAPQQRVIYVPDHLSPMAPVTRQRAASMRPPPPVQPPAEEISELEPTEVRHREYSRMPTARAAQDGYVRVNDDNFVRLQNAHRGRQATHFEQPQIMRVASVRPEHNIRYEAPPVEYYGRQHSQVSGTQARRERGMSIRGGDSFVDETSPIYRAFGTKLGEGMGPPRREYLQPVERYQSVRPAASEMDDEVEYVSQQPVRQVVRRAEGHVEHAPRRDPQSGSDGQPQYLPRRHVQQIDEDEDHQQVVYR